MCMSSTRLVVLFSSSKAAQSQVDESVMRPAARSYRPRSAPRVTMSRRRGTKATSSAAAAADLDRRLQEPRPPSSQIENGEPRSPGSPACGHRRTAAPRQDAGSSPVATVAAKAARKGGGTRRRGRPLARAAS